MAGEGKTERSNILMCTTEDGVTKVGVTFNNDTIWLSLDQIADLFRRNKSTMSRHIKNIFLENELSRSSVVANFATTDSDGERYHVDLYNSDAIISVDYCVRPLRGIQSRIWAINILEKCMIKGFALDDERLKNLGGGSYFDELLARTRDIRSPEKVLWREMLEIYATSVDYNPKTESLAQFFKQVQNEMHWAARKHIAAEVTCRRVDADKDSIGLTIWSSKRIKSSDVEVAKNYLDEKELDTLNGVAMAYLDIAEVHALNQEPMYTKDWLETIDDYLRMTKHGILTTRGKVTHQQALEEIHLKYEKYRRNQEYILSPAECHFLESVRRLDKLGEKNG